MKKTLPSRRRLSREMALKGVYQYLLNPQEIQSIIEQSLNDRQNLPFDEKLFQDILKGTLTHKQALEKQFFPFLERELSFMNPIEHTILLIATYELLFFPETPFRVILNEAIELAKIYGGTDGHKYINGVLDKVNNHLKTT